MNFKNDSLDFGLFCEEKVCEYLSNNKYEILEQRYRFKKGEIDIIAQKNKSVIFIEVKGRKNNNYGNPESFVDSKKEDLIFEVAEHFIEKNDINLDIRFDIIVVEGNFKKFKIIHFEDAFF